MRRLIRIVLALLLFGTPLIGDRITLPIFAIAVAAVAAHDGLTSRTVSLSVAYLILVELSWGIDFGTLSLAYLTSVLILRSLEDFLSVVPLGRFRDWPPGALIRAGIAASVMTWLMTGLSVGIEAVAYSPSGVGVLLAHAFQPILPTLFWTGLASCAILILLHRIEMPFRRIILFGT